MIPPARRWRHKRPDECRRCPRKATTRDYRGWPLCDACAQRAKAPDDVFTSIALHECEDGECLIRGQREW